MSALMQSMGEWSEKVSDYWLGISVRERQLLSLTGCLLVIWTVYFGVIRPVQTQVEEAQQRVISSQKQYDQVISRAEKIAVLQVSFPTGSTSGRNQTPSNQSPSNQSPSNQAPSNQSLDVLINRTASEVGVTITGLNRQQDSLQVRVSPASFQTLIQWMTRLEEQGVNVSSLQIARTDKPGIVDVQQLRVEKEIL